MELFEVTQKQWELVMGDWPSYCTNALYRESRPVEQVSYDDIRGSSAGTNWPAMSSVDATSFMGRLRARAGNAVDLPTESQWEYACRAGTTTALNSGYNLTNTYEDAHMSAVGRYWNNNGSNYTQSVDLSGATAKVGSYQANAWGLYDMHGNVWEWCLDWYGTYPGTAIDPAGGVGSNRVARGGAWYTDGSGGCRSAVRSNYSTPSDSNIGLGFRVALLLGQR
jgi:formylglycine-generating enzyme required for sulfatase activity